MGRNVARISFVNGKQPLFDNSGDYYFFDGTYSSPPGNPEYQPYRGFTKNYCDIFISGIELTGEIYEDGTPLSNFNGPMEGSLMVLWLITKSGARANLGQWTQVGYADYNDLTKDSVPGSVFWPYGPTIPNLGGWTKFAETPNTSGVSVIGYYRIATRREARSKVRWRIQTAPAGQSVISNVLCFMIRPQWFREPFNPVINTRVMPLGRSFRVPGVRPPTTPDVDASESGYVGGNVIMSVSAVGGSWGTQSGKLLLVPGIVGNEGYAGFQYGPYNPPYQMFYSYLTTYGMADNVVVPDGFDNTQRADMPDISFAGITIAFPSPPNVQIPLATNPLHTVTNTFESGNITDNFTVSGAGVPKIVP